jgi:hypothetical protein
MRPKCSNRHFYEELFKNADSKAALPHIQAMQEIPHKKWGKIRENFKNSSKAWPERVVQIHKNQGKHALEH